MGLPRRSDRPRPKAVLAVYDINSQIDQGIILTSLTAMLDGLAEDDVWKHYTRSQRRDPRRYYTPGGARPFGSSPPPWDEKRTRPDITGRGSAGRRDDRRAIQRRREAFAFFAFTGARFAFFAFAGARFAVFALARLAFLGALASVMKEIV